MQCCVPGARTGAGMTQHAAAAAPSDLHLSETAAVVGLKLPVWAAGCHSQGRMHTGMVKPNPGRRPHLVVKEHGAPWLQL